MNSWIEQLLPIIEEFKDGSDEPLDGDNVDDLIHIIKAKINLQEGNITDYEYHKLLDKDDTNFILVPISTINDSNVSFILLRLNKAVRSAITTLKVNTDLLGQSSLIFKSDIIAKNTILVSSDYINLDDNVMKIINTLKENYDDAMVVEVGEFINDKDFDLLYESSVNWNEDVTIDISDGGVYFSNRFETDYIESFMLDYSELNIFFD